MWLNSFVEFVQDLLYTNIIEPNQKGPHIAEQGRWEAIDFVTYSERWAAFPIPILSILGRELHDWTTSSMAHGYLVMKSPEGIQLGPCAAQQSWIILAHGFSHSIGNSWAYASKLDSVILKWVQVPSTITAKTAVVIHIYSQNSWLLSGK